MPEDLLLSIALRVDATGAAADRAFVDVSIDTRSSSVSIWRVANQPLPESVRRRYEAVARSVTLRYRGARLSNDQKAELDRLVAALLPAFEEVNIRPTSWGLLDGWDRPYVITYAGEQAPPIELAERFLIFGDDSVVFREGDIVTLAGLHQTPSANPSHDRGRLDQDDARPRGDR